MTRVKQYDRTGEKPEDPDYPIKTINPENKDYSDQHPDDCNCVYTLQLLYEAGAEIDKDQAVWTERLCKECRKERKPQYLEDTLNKIENDE